MSENHELQLLMERADKLLTDSNHPLDPKQTSEVTLMLIQQIVNQNMTIQRELADLKVNLTDRRAALDSRIEKIEDDVAAIKTTMTEYPSLTWLLRYKTTPTMRWIAAFLFVLWLVWNTYPAFATWLGLPPLPLHPVPTPGP